MTRYLVWWPEVGHGRDDGKLVIAHSPEDAAARWAQWYDAKSADYLIVGGQQAEVLVLEQGTDEPVRVRVRGEQSANYYGLLLTHQGAQL